MAAKRKAKDDGPKRIPIKQRRKFALEDLVRAAKPLPVEFIEALAIVASAFVNGQSVLTKSAPFRERFNEAIRHMLFTLGAFDPVTRAVLLRLQAELEATGAGKVRH